MCLLCLSQVIVLIKSCLVNASRLGVAVMVECLSHSSLSLSLPTSPSLTHSIGMLCLSISMHSFYGCARSLVVCVCAHAGCLGNARVSTYVLLLSHLLFLLQAFTVDQRKLFFEWKQQCQQTLKVILPRRSPRSHRWVTGRNDLSFI